MELNLTLNHLKLWCHDSNLNEEMYLKLQKIIETLNIKVYIDDSYKIHITYDSLDLESFNLNELESKYFNYWYSWLYTDAVIINSCINYKNNSIKSQFLKHDFGINYNC